LLVILPVWGSFEYPIEKVAKRVRDRYQGKVHIAAVLGEQRLLDWDGMAAAEDADALRRHSEISAERIRVAVVDIRRLLDWAELQPEIDPQRIALTGFSIGAVVGSLVVTQEPRLAASTLIMGGANPAQLLTYCNRIAGRTRQEVTERLGMDEQQYMAIMSAAFDPLNLSNFRGSVDPSRVLVVDAGDDD
jgi:dienelactone hydrolase